ncbi:MAG: exodeoxyribonuclease VII large subunit [Alphaproteobacteria bacterium RIFCSPLOWO2_01_FULL_40_26]|nr:MAG: exodeoxyribonuclease VII large subunit [Alphaproteobacteria bacterium RIFCSPHIGHO2_02_FULL_40_34]OFW88834.1 MAG: exodeoxyribonuclease VII large subunit [Alphaproteobacteria bacterium RIFCSPHIGHO2_01_FULL_40_8]OFW93960.1 MAG: exodeoxyribonuclease VII large subunit [Alphaproteobacteria bacterium RIFCSPLOWO2_01_FULL_40_26]OFX09672.1 MAG: exodeoxyribonuclease VII large subunit [Alphaproteobacteria bacterium RIFCSPLOWO2_02_FULL_40_19]OFX12001.1 MAG: exodeoxyribonuclease VII large subunit [Al
MINLFNVPEFTVSEFSRAIKRTVEDAFGYVRIKGEISGFKRAASGHLYFNLKDENSVLSAVCFRGLAALVDFEIGDGLQVCAFGRITTYEGRSNYQIIVEKLEIAGIGAILEMIEKRRQKLLAEGLFDEIHKKPIPFFSKIIGVITSSSGAVIEDIKHRIEARCGTHLMIYSSAVQGEKAVFEIISGIRFFNALKKNRPDVLIIARGGGSFEDLLAFNDENLVREVFKSEIPVISAVGHETDTTLIDYVADLRAPTPTAAAELATPVLFDLKSRLNFFKEKLEFLPQSFLENRFIHLNNLRKYLIDPKKLFEQIAEKLRNLQISNQLILAKINAEKQRTDFVFECLRSRVDARLREEKTALENLGKFLKSNHYREILKRGFALVKDEKGKLISSITEAKVKEKITIEMSDGEAQLVVRKS